MRIAAALLLVLLSAGLSGCWSFRKKVPKPLPPLASPAIVIQAPPTPVDVPPEATAPIPIEPPSHPPDVTFPKLEVQPEPEETKTDTPQPKATAKKPVTPSSPATSPPAIAPAPDAPETLPVPPPQLGELISGERRLELRNEIEQSLERARAALNLASRRSLTCAQNETANRIRTFIRQTEEARARDISTAVQLARRADLLAQDLAVTFK